MVSSQARHYITGFDEMVQESDSDFSESGLKVASIIRVGRLAVVSGEFLLGAIVKFPVKDWDALRHI